MTDASHCQPPLYSSFLSQVSGPPRKFGCIHGFAAIYRHHWHKWEAFLFIFKISLALPSVFFTEVQSHRVIQIEYRKICMAFHNVLLSGRRLNISAENDCRRLHCSLRDLSSLLQAVGRLAEYFIGEIFAARFTDALAVVERSVL